MVYLRISRVKFSYSSLIFSFLSIFDLYTVLGLMYLAPNSL